MVADRLADTTTVLLLTVLAFLLASKTILGFLHENGESYAAIARLFENRPGFGSAEQPPLRHCGFSLPIKRPTQRY